MPGTASLIRSVDHVAGAPEERVLVVEYGDFQCPYCKAAAPIVRHLLNRHSSQVRVAFRHFPLVDVHRHALAAALASEAAAAQGQFWEMHDLLFRHQTRLELPQLRTYAAALGLDLQRYDADMEDPMRLERVLDDIASGQASGVRATPTFFVDGQLQDVSYGIAALARRVEAHLSTKAQPNVKL